MYEKFIPIEYIVVAILCVVVFIIAYYKNNKIKESTEDEIKEPNGKDCRDCRYGEVWNDKYACCHYPKERINNSTEIGKCRWRK